MSQAQALNATFPLGCQVEAFHSETLNMQSARVTGYLRDVSCAPYGLIVTFTDSFRGEFYRAYIDADNPEKSLVVIARR